MASNFAGSPALLSAESNQLAILGGSADQEGLFKSQILHEVLTKAIMHAGLDCKPWEVQTRT